MDFYSYALIRNFIRFLLEDNPSDEEIEKVPVEIKENLCSLPQEDVYRLVEETMSFISSNREEKDEVMRKIRVICERLTLH